MTLLITCFIFAWNSFFQMMNSLFALNSSYEKMNLPFSLFSYWTSLLEIQKCGSFIIIFSGMLFFKNYCARAKSPTNMLIYVIIYYGHWRQNRRKLFDKLCFECHMILHNCNEYKIHNSNYFSLIRMTLSH